MTRSRTSLFDDPWPRDWLFWLVVAVAAINAVLAVAAGGSWVRGVLTLVIAFIVGGIVFGTVRRVVRGTGGPRRAE